MERLYEILVIFCAIGAALGAYSACDSISPGGQHCAPFLGTATETCTISAVESAAGKSWLDAQTACEAENGRLLWTTSKFQVPAFGSVVKMTDIANYNLIYTGLMMSAAGDQQLFWKPNIDYDNYTCGSKETYQCSTTVDNTTCQELGCCMKNGQCLYPDTQTLTLYKDKQDNTLNTSLIHTQHGRTCVGVYATNAMAHTWTAVDCLEKGDANTGYICQYNCEASWKEVDLYNVTLILAEEVPEEAGLSMALVVGAAVGGVAVIGLSTTVIYVIIKKKGYLSKKVDPETDEPEKDKNVNY